MAKKKKITDDQKFAIYDICRKLHIEVEYWNFSRKEAEEFIREHNNFKYKPKFVGGFIDKNTCYDEFVIVGRTTIPKDDLRVDY